MIDQAVQHIDTLMPVFQQDEMRYVLY